MEVLCDTICWQCLFKVKCKLLESKMKVIYIFDFNRFCKEKAGYNFIECLIKVWLFKITVTFSELHDSCIMIIKGNCMK